MHITETRDMVEGILLALDREKAAGEAFNLGSTEPFDFAGAVPRMAEATGLPLHVIDLPGTGVYYHTSNRKIRDKLGFQPKWTIDSMIAEAVRPARRNARPEAGGARRPDGSAALAKGLYLIDVIGEHPTPAVQGPASRHGP